MKHKKALPNFSNEAIDIIPEEEYLCLGADFEGESYGIFDDKMNEYKFLLDRIVPNMFVFLQTGIYLFNPLSGEEYYDNYNNRSLIIPTNVWKQYLPELIKKEKYIYENIGVHFPDELQNLLNEKE